MATLKPPTITWVNRVYRGHDPRWAYAPASGDGAKDLGGRFNWPGLPALYAATSPNTVWLEAQQSFSNSPQPITLCAYDVNCADMVDLTRWRIRRQMGIDRSVLSCPWEDIVSRGQTPPSWNVASQLIRQGIAGIVVPSFANGAAKDDINVVFWAWSDNEPHKVAVIDDENRLPKDDRSWH